MYKGQKSVRGGIEDFLCPFTDMYITQGSHMYPSHMGIMANDVRGIEKGVRYPIYAPCSCKCIRTYPESGQAMWQSLRPVRFANGRIDYATFMIAHDNTMDCYPNMEIAQGSQIANMGDKGKATGVHTHIEISQSRDTTWFKNDFGIWHFNNEYDLDDCYFVDNTNILYGMGGNWKVTSDVPVKEAVDQIIHVGSHVRLVGTYTVTEIDVPNNKSKINVEGEDVWLSSVPLEEVE